MMTAVASVDAAMMTCTNQTKLLSGSPCARGGGKPFDVTVRSLIILGDEEWIG